MSTVNNTHIQEVICPPPKENPQHPWQNLINDKYYGLMKYAHNSINNPPYPKQKDDNSHPHKSVHFTIIGNKLTKEFNYCVNVVKGLHKYRTKYFKAPTIRALTTVEWPDVLNDIKIKYGGLAYCLKSQVVVLMDGNILGGDEELKELLDRNYRYHLSLDYSKEAVDQFAKYIRSTGRPFVYMHFSIGEAHIGTMIFMLYADMLPYTSENFLRLCRAKKGGYSGTPVHRIVKDCWIQCGGYGLKSSDLDCENFMVPHDKRGVLCMANDGRHTDCSTQFFVLLQPAPWMEHKYVAFGQLVEGYTTLNQIENVPTWYESPLSTILIYKAGILNMDCQHITISKNTKSFLQGHVQDLVVLAQLLWEDLLGKVFYKIENNLDEESEDSNGGPEEEDELALRAVKRFRRNKSDIQKSQDYKSSIILPRTEKSESRTRQSIRSDKRSSHGLGEDNNDFDVEEYEFHYEDEHSDMQHYEKSEDKEIPLEKEVPYYIPLTNVDYDDDCDSTFDLKKFLRGDYCLESDLCEKPDVKPIRRKYVSLNSEFIFSDPPSDDEISLDSDDQKAIRRYLKLNVDHVSFAGNVVRNIAKVNLSMTDLFANARKSELLSDEVLRRFRTYSNEQHYKQQEAPKKVSISVPLTERQAKVIKRRQTGYIYSAEDSLQQKDSDESFHSNRKVRIAPQTVLSGHEELARPPRRPTGYVRLANTTSSDIEVQRQSVLTKLYDDVGGSDTNAMTLKDYKPIGEMKPKSTLLTYSSNSRIKSEDSNRERMFMRQVHTSTICKESYEKVLNLQHNKKGARKISTDYVKTIDQIEHRAQSSIRSLEFARTRPSMTVAEYQEKNHKYLASLKTPRPAPLPKTLVNFESVDTVMHPRECEDVSTRGLRLPGDSPLYSDASRSSM